MCAWAGPLCLSGGAFKQSPMRIFLGPAASKQRASKRVGQAQATRPAANHVVTSPVSSDGMVSYHRGGWLGAGANLKSSHSIIIMIMIMMTTIAMTPIIIELLC